MEISILQRIWKYLKESAYRMEECRESSPGELFKIFIESRNTYELEEGERGSRQQAVLIVDSFPVLFPTRTRETGT